MYKKNTLSKFIAIAFFALSLSLFTLSATDYSAEVLAAKNSIKGKMLLSHVEFLASKHCRGRETGTYGMRVATAYIESVLKGAGVEPAGRIGRYRQSVYLESIDLSSNCFLRIEESKHGSKLLKAAELEEDYLPVILSEENEVSAPLVFVGYGITATEHKYDDYKGIDAKGKIVLALRYEPREKDESSPFDGKKLSPYAPLLSKIKNAQKHGAVGIIFFTGPLNSKRAGASSCSGTFWPSIYKARTKDDEESEFIDWLKNIRISDDDFGVRIPVAAIDGKLAGRLIGEKHSIKTIQEKIDKTMKPRSFPIAGKKISMAIYFKTEPIDAYNLVAKVEGSDPELKKEVVIVGAHYDHMGKKIRGQLYPGADDNASGTAGVIELARAFQNLQVKPKRSILFLLFTAEEKGLYGSRFYVDHPIFPVEKTRALINLDMIGRNNVDQVSMLGRYHYPKLWDIVDAANRASGNMEINFNAEGSLRRSDQMPFLRKKIPSLYFNSGYHDQYHRPEDTAVRIIPEKMEKIVRLVFLSLYKIADQPAGTRFDGTKTQ